MNAGRAMLWFDVGIVRYTTVWHGLQCYCELWFDVGIVRYTTNKNKITVLKCCGLM